jgi:hypothetical protein
MKRAHKVLLALGLITAILATWYNLPEAKQHLRTPHFTFNYSSSIHTEKIKQLAGALEESYSRIGNDLNTSPANIIETNIYASRWRYGKATGNWGASGSIEGIAKLHFVDQAWSEGDSKKVAVHEFTHAVVLKMLIDHEKPPFNANDFDKRFEAYPVWLWEAVSCYEAGQTQDLKNEPWLANGSYPALAELNDRSKGGKIYKTGYSIIEFILQRYGKEKLIELILNDGHIQSVLHETEAAFSKEWYEFVKEKYL